MGSFSLSAFAAECRVADPERFTRLCGRFFELLTAANADFNLMRITSREDFEVKHVADSLAVARCFPELAEKSWRIADIGCGAGFPSVVLAAAFPHLDVRAIDSTHKKVDFVTAAAPLLASPTTSMSAALESSDTSPVLTIAWSSATSTLILSIALSFLHLCRRYVECDRHLRAAAGRT